MAGQYISPTRVELHALDLLRSMPVGFIAWGTDWRCTGVNPEGELLCGPSRAALLGNVLWEIFPDVVGTEFETVYRRVAASGTAENLEIFYPEPLNKWLDIHVTGNGVEGVAAYFLDVTARHEAIDRELDTAQQLLTAFRARDAAAAHAASLAGVALALTRVDSVEELEAIVIGQGLTTLGVDGGAIVSGGVDGEWRITVNAALGERVQLAYASAPHDSPLPACWAARTGRRLLLPTVASGLAYDPVMERVYEDTQRDGWAFFPLTVRGQRLGSLAVSWVDEYEPSPTELELLAGFAAQCALALYRVEAIQAERRTATEVRELAEALQRAMLTDPPQPPGLQIEARYTTAQNVAEVGGDWYDAFQHPDGSTMIVIGDVSGHDSTAAAQMGQLRGLLRGLAYTRSVFDTDDQPVHGSDGSSAEVLGSIVRELERTARGLGLRCLATLVLARLSASPEAAPRGDYQLQWTNAGHPPPLLIEPGGRVRVLSGERADLLFGVDANAERFDHTTPLPVGSTLLLYTDGLIERRGEMFDDGMNDITHILADLADRDLPELCDQVLERMSPHRGDDDIALIAIRTSALS